MADLAIKLKMLWLYRGAWADWYHDVWKRSGDQNICCNGYACGCLGASHYEMWEHIWKHRNAKSADCAERK